MSWIKYLFDHAVAGLWNEVFHWGICVALIILSLALAFATQLFNGIPVVGPWIVKTFEPLRKDLCWFALAVALFSAGMWVGGVDVTNRASAQQLVTTKKVDAVVLDSKSPKARSTPDPFDSKDN